MTPGVLNALRAGALVPAAVAALSTALVTTPLGAAVLIRVTCTGVQHLSRSEDRLSCDERDDLTRPGGGMLNGFTTAEADVRTGLLVASSGGGAARDGGYNGGGATSLFKETLRVTGDWEGGPVPVTARMRLRYGFGGLGRAGLTAILSTTSANTPHGDNRITLKVEHAALTGAVMSRPDSGGVFSAPAPGFYPSGSEVELTVTQAVPTGSTVITLRAYLGTYAQPTIGSLADTMTALAGAEGTVVVHVPCQLAVSTGSGAFGPVEIVSAPCGTASPEAGQPPAAR